MNEKELKKIVREAFSLNEKEYFKNISSIGTKDDLDAPSEKDDSKLDKETQKKQDEIAKKTPFLQSDAKKFSKNFDEIQQILRKTVRLTSRNKKEIEEFYKQFNNINKQYKQIREKALKDIRVEDKLSRDVLKKFENISLKFKDLFSKRAPKALKDKRIINWFQIK